MLQFDFNDLGLDLSGHVFTMGKTIGFDLFLRNNGSQPLTLRNADQISVEDAPDLDEAWPDGTDAMVCMVRFDYGREAGSLTTPEQAQLITASLVEQPNWSIQRITSGRYAPYWKFLPQNNFTLQPGDCITVRFSSIVLSDRYGEANLYFLLKYDQDYSRNLPIRKVYLPRILSLTAQPELYHLRDTIQLQWELENALDCKQYLNHQLLPDSDRRRDVRAVSDERYILNVVNQAGDGDSAAYDVVVPCIDRFELVSISHESVTLYWRTFPQDTSRVYLREFPGEFLQLEETKSFQQNTEDDCTFTLIAHQMSSRREVTRQIEFHRPTLQAQAYRLYRRAAPMGLPPVGDAFLSPALLRQSDGLTDSIVTMKGPVPISQVAFSWTTTNAVSVQVSVEGEETREYRPEESPTISIGVSIHQATVTATDRYGYTVEQIVTF